MKINENSFRHFQLNHAKKMNYLSLKKHFRTHSLYKGYFKQTLRLGENISANSFIGMVIKRELIILLGVELYFMQVSDLKYSF